MRKVMIHEYTEVKDTSNPRYGGGVKTILQPTGRVGLFHQFGIDFEELVDGIGQYTSAIIEMQDGTVKNIPVKMIKFIKEE